MSELPGRHVKGLGRAMKRKRHVRRALAMFDAKVLASAQKRDDALSLALAYRLTVRILDVTRQSGVAHVYVPKIQKTIEIDDEPGDLPCQARRNPKMRCHIQGVLRIQIVHHWIKPKSFSTLEFGAFSRSREITDRFTHGYPHPPLPHRVSRSFCGAYFHIHCAASGTCLGQS